LDFRATGTGTDNVLVVQGEGPVECFAGGHSKIGELIARLSGRSDVTPVDIPSVDALPVVMARAFGALVAGITEKDNEK